MSVLSREGGGMGSRAPAVLAQSSRGPRDSTARRRQDLRPPCLR